MTWNIIEIGGVLTYRNRTVSTLDQLPEALRQHRQLEEASCAVSAFECIGKLLGRVAPSAFPFQSDPLNQHLGFGERKFLRLFDLDATDDHYDTASAVAVIERETRAGRFPLVSLWGPDQKGVHGYHVFLCAEFRHELILIDPEIPAVALTGRADLAATLEDNRSTNPERTTLHLLTYRTMPPHPSPPSIAPTNAIEPGVDQLQR